MWQFYYNESILAEAGYDASPATWDELAAMAGDITADTDGDGTVDRWGYCEPWGENFASYPFLIHLRAAGGKLFNEDGTPAFNSPAGVEALTWMVAMAESGNACPSAFELTSTGNMAELFAQGNIGMMAGTTQTFRLAEDPEGSNVVGMVRAGLMPGAEVPTATFAETAGLAIPATAANPDLAWEYIQFVTSFDEEKAMAMELSSIPALTEALTDPDVQETYEHFQYVEEQMENPFGIIRHPNATEVNAAIARHVIAALNGVESPQDALDLAAQEVSSIIE
jgi:multiple sugar transport system substrate-binding protein